MHSTALSLQRDQRRVLGLLAVLCVASWTWSFHLAARMPEGPHQHADSLWPLTLMWGAMMVAMMVPPEVPRLLWLVQRAPLAQALAFLAGYLAPWMVASLGAAVLQARLGAAGLLTAEMATGSRPLGGVLLLAAGAMELSPLKRACLEQCRSRAPGARALGEGVAGPLLRGARHGMLSVASCGVLMLVLFVTGVMSPLAMVLLTALLLLEAIAPRGWPVRWVAGLALLGWGAWLILV